MGTALVEDKITWVDGTLRFESLYREHAPAALRLAYLLTGDHAAAEDLMQDAFVRVGARWRTLREPDAFVAYLRKAIVNGFRSRLRRSLREKARLQRRALLDYATRDREADRVGAIVLWEHVAALPTRQQAALILRYYNDLSEREIAEALGCKPGTVKSLLSRGLEALRKEIGHD